MMKQEKKDSHCTAETVKKNKKEPIFPEKYEPNLTSKIVKNKNDAVPEKYDPTPPSKIVKNKNPANPEKYDPTRPSEIVKNKNPANPDSFLTWHASTEGQPRNIIEVLKHELHCSGTMIRRLRQAGMLFVDGNIARVVDKIHPGSILQANLSDTVTTLLVAENIPIQILFEDDTLIAIDKEDRIAVHPSSIYRSGTLANAVAYHMQGSGFQGLVRPVTRLDRNTSGITLFAKNAHAQYHLSKQAKNSTFIKKYLGLCLGKWEPAAGTICLPLQRKPGSIIEREVHADGRPSITHYQTVQTIFLKDEANGEFLLCSLVEFVLETGRTHQIRVHCQASGHPLLGDTLYGDQPWPGLAGQALHCHFLSFIHPVSGEKITLHSKNTAPMFSLLYSSLPHVDEPSSNRQSL